MGESADREWLDQARRSRDLADEQIRLSKLTIEESKELLRRMDEIAQVESDRSVHVSMSSPGQTGSPKCHTIVRMADKYYIVARQPDPN